MDHFNASLTFHRATKAETCRTIPGILDYSWGKNDSPEGLDQGYTHAFIMTFQDAAARDAYLPHPEHENAKHLILPHVAGVLVLDFAVI